SVPYQLQSSEVAKKRARRRQEWNAPGAVRRGPAQQGHPKEPSGTGSGSAPGSSGPDPKK
ncbi:hypothetical protein J2X68_006727, partial [Streptomyces sp. 3330]|uniref:hypothetical protein n=1 Tax=Streptomyces sp. 3330 TaxID=2817755 RepID=UPI002866CA57